MTVTWDPPRPGWTCAECGFDFDATVPDAVPEALRSYGERYGRPLSRGLPGEDLGAVLRVRPDEATWSALEYACHVRDALALYVDRIGLALREDRPVVPAMGRDDLPTLLRYNDQDPAEASAAIAANAERLAALIASVEGDQWQRGVERDDELLTVDWMARNALHECAHHMLDIGRVLRSARGR